MQTPKRNFKKLAFMNLKYFNFLMFLMKIIAELLTILKYRKFSYPSSN